MTTMIKEKFKQLERDYEYVSDSIMCQIYANIATEFTKHYNESFDLLNGGKLTTSQLKNDQFLINEEASIDYFQNVIMPLLPKNCDDATAEPFNAIYIEYKNDLLKNLKIILKGVRLCG